MDPTDPMSPGAGGSRLRDVGRTVTSEAAGHIDRLKKSERTKAVVDKTVDWTAQALEDPSATAERLKEQAKRLWQEDEKVVAVRERTKEMLNNALHDEEKMQKVRRRPPRTRERSTRRACPTVAKPFSFRVRPSPDARDARLRARTRGTRARTRHRPTRPEPFVATRPIAAVPLLRERPTDVRFDHHPVARSPLPRDLFVRDRDPAQARGVSSRVFGIVERLASKNNSKVSETFGVAAHKLKGLVASETDNEALLANGKEVAVDAWRALRDGVSGDGGALGDIRTTTSRIMHRLKDVMKQLQEDKMEAEKRREAQIAHADAAEAEAFSRAKNAGADDESAAAAAAAARELTGHVTFTTGPDGKLVCSTSEAEGDDARLGKLAREGKSVWEEVRADEKVQRLIREEIAPGFENLIRASVEVICDLMSTLELPRVDGIYDSPLGSVCYHVDDLAFSEFVVAKDGLRVANQTGENGERAGFGSTVSIEGIRTKMRDIKFAYCEHPKNWGVVDGEGLCTVKVDGARVGISYDIVVNTPELMRLVNQSVELSKDEARVGALREKVKAKFARGSNPGGSLRDGDDRDAAENPASRRASIDSFHSAGSAEASSPSPARATPAARAAHADADAALDAAFGGGVFGGDGEEDDDDDEFEAADNENDAGGGWGWGVDAFWGGSSPSREDAVAAAARVEELSVPLTAAQKEKLERHRAMLRELLGEEFVVTEPVVELRVHATSIHVGQLDVEIGGTSAAWLYNMIALVLTQQLRGTIEERINNLTVRQLGKLSGTVEAYSAGLIKVTVVRDHDSDEEEPEQSMLGSWVSGGGLGKLRRDCGEWGRGWQCSHWEPGGVIRRTPSARGEIMKADGSRELAPMDAMEALALQTREEEEHSSEEEDGGLSGAAAGSVF